MKGISSKWKVLMLFVCVLLSGGLLFDGKTEAFSSQMIQRGAVGDDVISYKPDCKISAIIMGALMVSMAGGPTGP